MNERVALRSDAVRRVFLERNVALLRADWTSRDAGIAAVLAKGESLIIFPEGTRAFDRLPGAFKPGLFHLAEANPGVELVPVFLDNLHRALPKGSLLPAPIICAVRFGAPIALEPGETKPDFAARARAAVVALA